MRSEIMTDSPTRILLWLPNWVGDVVMATPAMEALRRRFPASHIALVGRKIPLETLSGLPYFDEGIVDGFAAGGRVRNTVRLAMAIRRGRFDLGVLLPNSFRTVLVARLGGVRRLAGYNRDGRGWLLSQSLPPPVMPDGSYRPYPAIDYYNDLVRLVGAEPLSRRMTLAVTPEACRRAQELLEKAGFDPSRPLVMLNPGGAFGPSKLWSPDRYAAVADALGRQWGAQIIINSAPAEQLIAFAVADAMRQPPLINFAKEENSLNLLKALLGRCQLLITNDTGARHVAAAMNTAVVTLFGSTDPRWARIDYERERIVRVDVPCSPCQKKQCPNPAGATFHQCMEAITVEMVLQAAGELLGAPTAPAREPTP